MRNVYVAGRGLASALGPDLTSGLRALRRGVAASRAVQLANGDTWPLYAIAAESDDQYADQYADQVGDPHTNQHADQAAVRFSDHGERWMTRARRITRRVADESGALAGARTGPLFVASSSMDIGAREDSDDANLLHDSGQLPKQHADYQRFAETVGEWLDWRGPVFTVTTACTSSLNAMLSAHALIRRGQAEHALVLGVELYNRVTLGGFVGMQLLAPMWPGVPTRALPLGAARAGLVLGEAVAAVHLSAQTSRWRFVGGANIVDGRDPAGAVPSAIIAMCTQALANSGLVPADIGLLKLQAAGSPSGDAIEVRALRQVFDPLPPLLSFKGAIGHTLGAAGAAELALLLGCLEGGVWPVCDYPQDASLQATLTDRAPAQLRYVLASILGFGGGHAAVILQDCGA